MCCELVTDLHVSHLMNCLGCGWWQTALQWLNNHHWSSGKVLCTMHAYTCYCLMENARLVLVFDVAAKVIQYRSKCTVSWQSLSSLEFRGSRCSNQESSWARPKKYWACRLTDFLTNLTRKTSLALFLAISKATWRWKCAFFSWFPIDKTLWLKTERSQVFSKS